ncbi:hypothetical protein [Oceanobacillus bengalensis]|uniref:Uncharacterized protein n=1 Tax=Oceanobacillus bengalensis TaxID=1435466 RepID=A0A494Z4X8_9BACI|nr:hypothetical protein [Oceanobacillus bengalensis]RKQ17064.1 hypothetical protein D8M05_05160 [Oceanobacillus bengalensis]
MKINTSYPYPVLYMNNDDYVRSAFRTDIAIHEAFGEVKIHVQYNLENEVMERLIEKERSVYLIHVECAQTSFRNVYRTTKNELEVSIPTKKLRGKIDIHSFVIANERIEGYTNPSLNEWFQGIALTFEKGNILAIGDAIETTLYEENLEMLDLPSIAKVTKSLKNEFMEVELNSDIITISLPAYEYSQYAMNAKSNLKDTILATVILPSLVYVFTKLNDNQEDLEEYTWYQVLDKIFADNNHRIEDVGSDSLSALKAAQMVLRKPLKASFEEIEKRNRMED